MKFHLWHNLNPTWEASDEAVQEATYALVASGEAESLNEVYELSQNIQGSWVDDARCGPNPWIIWIINYGPGFPGGYRSTSVGDLIQVANKFYVVAPFGFREVSEALEAGWFPV